MGRVKGWVCNACVGCVRFDSGIGAGERLLKPGNFSLFYCTCIPELFQVHFKCILENTCNS
jgi:hypothetical protein